MCSQLPGKAAVDCTCAVNCHASTSSVGRAGSQRTRWSGAARTSDRGRAGTGWGWRSLARAGWSWRGLAGAGEGDPIGRERAGVGWDGRVHAGAGGNGRRHAGSGAGGRGHATVIRCGRGRAERAGALPTAALPLGSKPILTYIITHKRYELRKRKTRMCQTRTRRNLDH